MRYSNIHTHTTFSDGNGSVRENIESAISKNMLSIGISDHSYTFCDTSYCIKKEAYSDYFKTINELKKEYAEKIDVLLGLELDYYSNVQREKFDYIVSSVHYLIKNGVCYPIDHSIHQQRNCIHDAFGGNELDMVKAYFELVVNNVQKNKPDCIGHFDIITKYSYFDENNEEYQKICTDALREALKYCNYVEVNTGAIARQIKTTPYPAPFILKEILKQGGEVVLNSDCHDYKNLTFYFDETVELLKKIGFNHISYLTKSGYKTQNI